MPFPKKWISLFSFLTVGTVVWLMEPYISIASEPPLPPSSIPVSGDVKANINDHLSSEENIEDLSWDPNATIIYKPGTVKPVGEVYTKTIIVPKTKDDDVAWIEENFGKDPNVRSAVYVVDDVTAEFHTPRNKGHEVLAYLSFIVEQYHNLSDVNVFLHSHRYAWHNNELLGSDAVEMVNRLSSERVQREGYMNMRCHWGPGCPAWMHPLNVEEDINKQEESILARSWSELFPFDPIPHVLAQPCCAQFALSADRIRSLPLARYVFFRDWLLRTPLSDYISGRVWEYVWQFIFTGMHKVCPEEHVCYCDGFGVCFGGESQYRYFTKRWREIQELEDELRKWHEEKEKFEQASEEEKKSLAEPEVGLDLELEGKIRGIRAWGDDRIQQAKAHGEVAMNRAKEAGIEVE